MRKNYLILLLVFFLAPSARASTALDSEYSYRNIAAIVTNVDKEPVYGERVENEIVSFLRTNMRFEFSDKGYLYLKDKFRPFRVPESREPSALYEPSRNLLKELKTQG